MREGYYARMAYRSHLVALVWRNTGSYARIAYLGIAGINALFTQPVVRKFPPSAWVLDMIGGGQEIAGIPWDVATVLIIVSMLLFTIAGLARTTLNYEKELTPRILVAFEPDGGGMVRTPEKQRIKLDSEVVVVDEWETIYIRLGVETIGKKAAKHCTAYLNKVESLDSEGAVKRTYDDDSLQLAWAHIGSKEVNIPNKIKRHVDVAKVNSRTQRLALARDEYPLTMRGFFDDIGTFIFSIVVVAEDLSEVLRIRIDLPEQWDDIKAEILDGERQVSKPT